MRCVDLEEKQALERKIQHDKELKKRSNLLFSSYPINSKSNENISNQKDPIFSNTTKQSPLKAIKEFSYFDWSKVKLFNRTINDDEDKDIYDNRNKSLEDSFTYQNIQSFQNDNKKIKDLPQVITIRFI